jgi:hypothetical protein
MTPENTSQPDRERVLEEILDTVESIDKNVEEILDRLSDHFEDQRYHREWKHGLGYDPADDYEAH